MIDMKKITANLMVKDVNETIEYYVKNLDFVFVMGVDSKKVMKMTYDKDIVFNFAIIKKNDVEIMLQVQHSLIDDVPEFKGRTVGGTFTLYISMADTKSFYEKIKNKVDIVKPLHKTFYGSYEFSIRDMNGYILYFAQFQKDFKDVELQEDE